MIASELINLYKKDSLVLLLKSLIENNDKKNIVVRGLSGGLGFVIPSVFFSLSKYSCCFVLENKDSAFSFYYNLKTLLPTQKISLFPGLGHKYYGDEKIDNSNVVSRAESVSFIQEKTNKNKIVVTFPEAVFEKIINKTDLKKRTLLLEENQEISHEELENILIDFDFEQKDFVEKAGQYSIRGLVFDVFSFSNKKPFRLFFEENTIKKISMFNMESQLSSLFKKKISVLANPSIIKENKNNLSLLDYLDKKWTVWIKDKKACGETLDVLFKKTSKIHKGIIKNSDVVLSSPPKNLFVSKRSFFKQLLSFRVVEFGVFANTKNKLLFEYKSRNQPDFNKNLSLLKKDLLKHFSKGYTVSLAFQSEEQTSRVYGYFESVLENFYYSSSSFVLSDGFVDDNIKHVYYTDHQIFKRYFKHRKKLSGFKKNKIKSLVDYKELYLGDYVVHIDYGVGRFLGLDKLIVKNTKQEVVKISYQNNDIVYVGINSLYKFSKYVGDNPNPKLNKLGSRDWLRKKSNVQSKIKNIAKDLIELYAKRKVSSGFSFLPDDYLQMELETSFLYQDTPDQSLTIKEIKKDMESKYPMDRLVCGDVGFGKTEVAIRAAFKAVCNNKQVLILVPTTVLAFQHYNTFCYRLKDFPVNVNYVSRFRSRKEVLSTIKDCKSGKIDVLIGTQKVLNKKFVFKDLGLLIVDEEQKFGVALKEKIKNNKVSLDTLTLTATPIPRTLHFSLMGIRDISVIETPPPNRISIETEIISFDKKIIRDVIKKELDRFGQVFFVNNRVKNIYQIAEVVQKLIPDSKIGVAHGQLKGGDLEKIMIRFIKGHYDILVSTNIIESGLDVPNANTVIINNAHAFGLSDLHQIRGRVGRSNKKAYCYLITSSSNYITADARKRLVAISELSKLGDGLKIALKDLDIRGAGNLLGGEQSGFINDLGFDMYHKVLDEALDGLEEKKQISDRPLLSSLKNYDCLVELDKEVYIPTSYVSNHNERLKLYSKIEKADSKKEYKKIYNNLKDRFGPAPKIIQDLFKVKELKKHSFKLGFSKVVLKKSSLLCSFKEKKGHKYYSSKTFSLLLSYVKQNKSLCLFESTKKGLKVSFLNVFSLKKAVLLLKSLSKKRQ